MMQKELVLFDYWRIDPKSRNRGSAGRLRISLDSSGKSTLQRFRFSAI